MMNNNDLEQRYPDLLRQETDRAMYELVSNLDAAYTQPEAPPWLTWATIKAHYMEDKRAKRMRDLPYRFKLRQSFSFSMSTAIALMLVVVTVATATAFALSPQVRQVLGLASQSDSSMREDDFTILNQVRTVNGIEIKLEAAYADANQIAIGFLDRAINGKIQPIDTRLRTAQGQELSSSIGGFMAGQQENKNGQGEAWYYDATSISRNPKQLDLVLDVLVGQEKTSFAFTVPFHGGKRVTPKQSVTSQGVTLTLEQVVIARSGTSILVQGLPWWSGLIPDSTVKVPGEPKLYDQPMAITPRTSGPYLYMKFLYGYIPMKTGKWSFTITENTLPPALFASKGVKGGKWDFVFVVT